MQHVEEAGVHSGDSACVLPAQSLGVAASAEISSIVKRLGPALGVVGLLNVQLAVVDDVVFVLEVNPRASRTVPFASKATGVNLVAAACRLAAGAQLADLGLPAERPPRQVSVKAAVLPFARFPGADPVLGPEMRSTGEVMASATDLPTAFAKAERAAGRPLPRDGVVFLSVRDDDKAAAVPVAAALVGLGFQLVATQGTARTLRGAGLDVDEVRKVSTPGEEPSVVDLIRRGRCNLVVNTPEGGSGPRSDGYLIREAALAARVPCITTIAGAARPCTRSRTHAPRPRSPSRSGSMSKPRRERRSVIGGRGGRAVRARPGRPRRARSRDSRPVLHARGARPCPAAADVALPRAHRRARLPARSDRPRHACARGARAGRGDPRLRSARQRLPARRRPARCSSAAASGSRRSPISPRRSSIRRPCSASGRDWHAEAAALVPNAEVVIDPVLVTDAMPRDRDVLACGPEPMLEAVRALRPDAQLAWEAPMACGYGACYGCVVEIDGELRRLCVEGPVLCFS